MEVTSIETKYSSHGEYIFAYFAWVYDIVYELSL